MTQSHPKNFAESQEALIELMGIEISPSAATREFREVFKRSVRDRPLPTAEILGGHYTAEAHLQHVMLREEVRELKEAVSTGDIVEIADALADIVYLAYGASHFFGIPLDEVLSEVHRSNMTKLEDGEPVYYPNGKVRKGKDYEPPNIAPILELHFNKDAQVWEL